MDLREKKTKRSIMMYCVKEGIILHILHHDCGSFTVNDKQL